MATQRAFLALLATTAAVVSQGLPPIGRIAFGSCNREYKPQPIWKAVAECRPDLWIWLGDIVYGRADDLADLKRRYRSQKDRPAYAALRRTTRVMGVWDDHDYGVNDGGTENPHKVDSQKLLLDFLDEPAGSPRRRQAGVYTASTFGPPGRQVKVILLDGRYHREPSGPTADPLGAEQWAWLEHELATSRADVTLIGSGIQVIASEHPYEKWANFPQARERLFDLLAKTNAHNVIFLSGDRHLGEISRLTDARLPYPLYDITSSGLTHHAEDTVLHKFSREPNRFRSGEVFLGFNFGLININWEASPPTATLQVRDSENQARITETLVLQPAK